MIDENDKSCSNCEFDTVTIVTVETSDWNYCPVCGTRFESQSNTDAENMTEIPLGGENTENETSDENEENTPSQDSGQDTDIDDLQEDEAFVEDELDRLRDQLGDNEE